MQFQVVDSDLDGDDVMGSVASDLPDGDNFTVIYDELWQTLIDISAPEFVNDNVLNDLIDKRELWITERTQVKAPWNSPTGGRPLPMLASRMEPFGTFYKEATTELILQNKPTIWEFVNLSNDAHNIHLHQVRFKILDRQDVGLSYHTFQYPNGMYRQYPKDAS
jgi:FtsP/CotA-like multicopper oxidase with cupredoxin domain